MVAIGLDQQLATTSRDRAQWVDAVRGGTILAVVLLHSEFVIFSFAKQTVVWVTIDDALTYIRMPLMFFMSGLFVGRLLHRPSREFWGRRVAKFVYLAVVWSTLHVAFFAGSAIFKGRDLLLRVEDRARELPDSGSVLWYLYALAAFLGVARLLRKLPVWIQLLSTASLSVFLVSVGYVHQFGRAWMLVFFLGGYYLGPSLHRFLADSFVERLADAGWLAWLRLCGRNSLPIYVLHFPVLGILQFERIQQGYRLSPSLAPIVIVSVTVVLSLLIFRITRRVPGLYDMPRNLSTSLRKTEW